MANGRTWVEAPGWRTVGLMAVRKGSRSVRSTFCEETVQKKYMGRPAEPRDPAEACTLLSDAWITYALDEGPVLSEAITRLLDEMDSFRLIREAGTIPVRSS
jgi:hypothetical protein